MTHTPESLRSLPNEEIITRIDQFERNRDPMHMRRLQDGDVRPVTQNEENYVALVGEREYRIGIGTL